MCFRISSWDSLCAMDQNDKIFCATKYFLNSITIIQAQKGYGFVLNITYQRFETIDLTNMFGFAITIQNHILVGTKRIVYRTYSSDLEEVAQESWSINFRAYSVMVHDGYVLFGNRWIAETFYLCSKDMLQSCLENFTWT